MDGEIEEVQEAGDGDRQLAAAAAAHDMLINVGNVEQQPNGDISRFQRMIVQESRFWLWLSYLLAVLSIHSSVMTPLDSAFKVGDISSWVIFVFEVAFALDLFRQWSCVLIKMERFDLLLLLYEFIHHPRKLLETAPYVPWSSFTKSKYLSWFKIARSLRVKELFEKLENVRDLYYSPICFVKLILMQLYCIHLTACLFYHLASSSQGLLEVKNTWFSNIQIDNKNLTEMGIAQTYAVSLYYASVTLSTIGYGDIHAVNVKEMLVAIFLTFFSLVVWTYLGLSMGQRKKYNVFSLMIS